MILWWSGTSHKRQMSFEDRCMFCSHTEICIELLITSGIFDDVIDSRTKFELAVSVWGQESIHNLLELIQRKRQLFNVNEHFNHNQCDFLALLEAWWPNCYSQERRQQLQQFFSKGHAPKTSHLHCTRETYLLCSERKLIAQVLYLPIKAYI